jgi:hypothetical protein
VANALWAVATLGVDPGPEMLEGLAARAAATAGEFNSQVIRMYIYIYNIRS